MVDTRDNLAPFSAAVSGEEARRLAVLRSYGILDTPDEEAYDRFTRLAARLFDVSMVTISLIDENRQWFKSRVGLSICGSARDISFCTHVVDIKEPLIVPDTHADARFANNPFVTEEPHVRFYAGVPLRAPEGVILGTFCLLDDKPREFSNADLTHLNDIAAMVMEKMKLRHKEQLYRSLVEDGSEMVVIFNESYGVIYQSPAVERLLGYPAHEFRELKIIDLVHPDDRSDVAARYEQMLEEKCDVPLQLYRFRHKDGSWRFVECYARYQMDDPEIGGIVFIVRDVTERVEMERQLNQAETRVEANFQQSSLGMAMIALDGKFLRINDKFAELSGIEIARLSEYGYQDLMHSDEVEASIQKMGRLARGEENSLSVERRLIRRDGHSFWAQFDISLVRQADGEPDYLLSQVQDIDARRRQEERLRLLESVAVHANDAILITEAEPIDPPGPRILYANEAYCRMSGYTLEEVMGKTPRIMQGEGTDPAACAQIRRALERWKPIVIEVLNYTKAGKPFWVELSIVPVADEKGWYTHWVSLQRDVTARKEGEAAVKRAREEAEAANNAKSSFLSRVSHELRTPLNAILGFGQLLELEEQSLSSSESTAHILKAGHHLLELINEVLDISRIESGEAALSIEPLRIAEIAHEALDLIRPMAAEFGISLHETHVFDSPLAMMGDRRRVKQIVLNLLSNAIKYNRKGGTVTLSLELQQHPNRDGSELVRLCVTDTGTGIAPEKRERLWVAFDRLGAESSAIEGTGIGLALSLRLAQAMNGQLDFRSDEQGSTFWVELPVAQLPSNTLDVVERPVATGDRSPVATRWSALYIEDNLPNVQLMEGILAYRPQVRLLTAFEGETGIEMARQHQPDVILLDLHLPDINGDEVLRRLRADENLKEVPVIMISADATPGQVERLLAAGANDYMAKPFNIAHLLNLLDRYLISAEKTKKANSLTL